MGTYFSFLRRLFSRSQTVDTHSHLLCLNLSTVRNDRLSFCLCSSISIRLYDGKIPCNLVGSLGSVFLSVKLSPVICIWTEWQSLNSPPSLLLYTFLWSAALDWHLSWSTMLCDIWLVLVGVPGEVGEFGNKLQCLHTHTCTHIHTCSFTLHWD